MQKYMEFQYNNYDVSLNGEVYSEYTSVEQKQQKSTQSTNGDYCILFSSSPDNLPNVVISLEWQSCLSPMVP